MMKPRCAPSVESGEEYGMGNEKKLCQLSLYRVTMPMFYYPNSRENISFLII